MECVNLEIDCGENSEGGSRPLFRQAAERRSRLASEKPCLRHNSFTGTPLSASFRNPPLAERRADQLRSTAIDAGRTAVLRGGSFAYRDMTMALRRLNDDRNIVAERCKDHDH